MAIHQQIKKLFARFNSGSPAVKASMAYMFCTLLQKGISTLTTPIFTRLLTTEQYGYYNVFHSWLAVIKIFSTLMLAGSVYMQALVKFQDEKDRLTSSVAGLGTMTTLTVTAIYILFRDQINSLLGVDTFIMTCILVTAWEELLLDLWAMQQRVSFRYKPLIALTLTISLLKPLIGVIAVLSTDAYKAEARIFSSVLIDVLAYSGFFLLFMKRGGTFFDRKHWKYFLAFSIPLIPHFLTRIVLNQSDKLMIQMMVGYAAAGIYGLAHSLAWLLTLVTQALLNTISPWILQQIKAKQFSKIASTSYLTASLVAGAGLCLTAIAPEIVQVFAPAEYAEAVWIIPPLVASVYFTYLYSLFANFEYYYEAKRNILTASLLGGTLNIVLNYIFIYLFGYLAAGYTTLVCFAFLAVAHFWSAHRILQQKEAGETVFQLKPLLLISIVFLFAQFACMSTYQLPFLRYMLLGIGMAVMLSKREPLLARLKTIRAK